MTNTPAGPPSPPMKARRPYLLRAIHEWITDSLCTPHIVVDATVAGVEVPRQYVKDGKIVLNIGWNATANLRLGNEEITFSGRFGGASMSVLIPVVSVLAIYARETGQGMIFTDEDVEAPTGEGASSGPTPVPSSPPDGDGGDEPPPRPPRPSGGRAKLKVVK